MRKLTKLLIFALCVGVFLFYMGYFGKLEEKVDELTAAFNDQDIYAIMDIYDHPEMRKVKSAIKIGGAISDKVLGIEIIDLLFEGMPLIGSLADSHGVEILSWNLIMHLKTWTYYEQ